MLFPTRSKFPLSVNLVANPRTSRTVSAEPRDPTTVGKRTNSGVFFEGSWRRRALVGSHTKWQYRDRRHARWSKLVPPAGLVPEDLFLSAIQNRGSTVFA
jgi:hypothetical protein